MRLGITEYIDCAHFLPGHPKCGQVHGHTYRVDVTSEGQPVAVFTGTGEFTLYVPNASEREEFTRQTELGLTEDRYRWNFTRAVF